MKLDYLLEQRSGKAFIWLMMMMILLFLTRVHSLKF